MLKQLELISSNSIIQFFSKVKSSPGHSLVKPATLKSAQGTQVDVFYKEYVYPEADLHFFARASKAQREFINYQVFEKMGIACAERIACGEQRDWLGRLRHAFIITRAIPDALTLIEFVMLYCPQADSMAAINLRGELIHQLAAMVRHSHDKNFFHNDLYWRNILVTWTPPAQPKLWWIDCPRGRFDRWSPLRHHRRVKDLACLEKTAMGCCTRKERLNFIKQYLGISRLDTEAKRLICDIRRSRRLKPRVRKHR